MSQNAGGITQIPRSSLRTPHVQNKMMSVPSCLSAIPQITLSYVSVRICIYSSPHCKVEQLIPGLIRSGHVLRQSFALSVFCCL